MRVILVRKLDLPEDVAENRRVHAVLAFLRATAPAGPGRAAQTLS